MYKYRPLDIDQLFGGYFSVVYAERHPEVDGYWKVAVTDSRYPDRGWFWGTFCENSQMELPAHPDNYNN